MGFQLGPGFLRRAPGGWIPARAFALERRTQRGDEEGEVDTSLTVEVRWRVEPDGGTPYELHERRRMPTWVEPGAGFGAGSRWYKVRVRPAGGLLADVGVPARVNPKDPEDLWVDWDGAYALHEPRWAQDARVRREVHRRAGKVDEVLDRIGSPLSGRIRPDEVALADAAVEAERARIAEQEARLAAAAEQQQAAMGFGPVSPQERARSDARTAREAELGRRGRPAQATVVARTETDRTLANVPVVELVLDVDDGGSVRRVVYEHVWGPRHAKRYKPGRRIEVKVDPDDPDVVALAS